MTNEKMRYLALIIDEAISNIGDDNYGPSSSDCLHFLEEAGVDTSDITDEDLDDIRMM